MQDSFGRHIDYMRISVTDKCNLRCRYCMPEEGVPFIPHEALLTFEEIERLCHCLSRLGVRRLKITGGEPLVRKNIAVLIHKLKKIPGIEQVTLTTNGTRLKELLPELEAAGIDGINVSLDTLNRETFKELTRVDALEQVLQGIEALEASKVPSVKINCVPMEEINGQELTQIAAIARDSRIAVRFIEMMPIGYGSNFAMMGEMRVKQSIEQAFGQLMPQNQRLGNGPAVYYMLEGFKSPLGFISAMSHNFCGECSRIRLTSDGSLKTCLFYDSGTDIRKLLRSKADDVFIQRTVKEAIQQKPWSHPEDKPAEEARGMSQIGG